MRVERPPRLDLMAGRALGSVDEPENERWLLHLRTGKNGQKTESERQRRRRNWSRLWTEAATAAAVERARLLSFSSLNRYRLLNCDYDPRECEQIANCGWKGGGAVENDD